jgi:hypothetical protein
MSLTMDRIYRAQQGGESFFAMERGGDLFRAAGADMFSGLSIGKPISGGLGSVTLRAVRPRIVCVASTTRTRRGEGAARQPLLFINHRRCSTRARRSSCRRAWGAWTTKPNWRS